jgi:uncharacterized protein
MTITGVLLAAAGLSAGLAAWMNFEARRVTVRETDVELNRLPASFEGTRIFFISDIHRRLLDRRVVEQAAAGGRVDLVLIGGDLRERGVPLSRTRSNIKLLASLGPVYMVYGNHDYDDQARELEVLLREEGVRVLSNDSVVLEQRGGGRLRLAGVDDAKSGRDRLEMTLAPPVDSPGRIEQDCTILLAHDPIMIEKLMNRPELYVDLVLAGHTHGGQLVLPRIGPLYRSYTTLTYQGGWYELKVREAAGERRLRLFVSKGYGTSHLPLRLNAPAEAHVLILRQASRLYSDQ